MHKTKPQKGGEIMPLFEIKATQKLTLSKVIEANSQEEAELLALSDLDVDDFEISDSETKLDKAEIIGSKTYKIEITFKVEKELTESELSNLEGHLLLQLDEPYNEDNEPENYNATDTTYKIEKIN
jgi:hypothetical protein